MDGKRTLHLLPSLSLTLRLLFHRQSGSFQYWRPCWLLMKLFKQPNKPRWECAWSVIHNEKYLVNRMYLQRLYPSLFPVSAVVFFVRADRDDASIQNPTSVHKSFCFYSKKLNYIRDVPDIHPQLSFWSRLVCKKLTYVKYFIINDLFTAH